jgi:two-component system, NarL family, nitrate/nitrite response regulator NarL
LALRVALISTSPLVLAGLRTGLNEHEGVDVVWMGQTLADWQNAGFAGADVAIVDVGADAVAALDALGYCAGPAFVLLADDQSNHVNSLLEEGFTVLPRDASLEMIAGAAHAAAAGLVATSLQLWGDALRFARLGDGDGALDFEPLTPREKEVVAKMSLGLGNREIAHALQISIHTAKFHVAQIISKLEANSRAHAVAKALRAGLVEQ